MVFQKILQPMFVVVSALVLVATMLLFAGCRTTESQLTADEAMNSVVAMWEQVKTDAEAAGNKVKTNSLLSLGEDASNLTLVDSLEADYTGVNQLLCFDFITASLYIFQTLSKADSNYKLGKVFSGDSIITQETAGVIESYKYMANKHITVDCASFNLYDNVASGGMIVSAAEKDANFDFYVSFEAVFDSYTKVVTHFNVAFYDNKMQGAGEILSYFTGTTYANMKGIVISVDSSENQIEKTFASKVKRNAETLYGKTVDIKNKDFSTEMNRGLVYGAGLYNALVDKNN